MKQFILVAILSTSLTKFIFSQAPLQTSSKVVVDDGYDYTELSVTPWGGSHGIFFGSKVNYTGSQSLWDAGNTVYARDAGQYGYSAFSMGYIANGGVFSFYDGGLSTGTENPITWNPVMTMVRGGNVGIGTTNPTLPLTVQGSIQGRGIAAFTQANPVNSLLIDASSSSFHKIYNNVSNVDLSIGTNNSTTQLYLKSDGSVGIGTSTPQAKLAVNGDIFSRKVKVTQTGWPDYVFNATYQLLPLKDLEKYIKSNNHLPGVPSATDVEKNGLDLGDNQAVLLKKIEELTLYIIQQDKKIQSQDDQIKLLLDVKQELEIIKAKLRN